MKKLMILSTMLLSFGFANSQTIWTSETKLKGTVGKQNIMMTLAIPFGGASSCTVVGEYYYASIKKNINLCSEDDEKIIKQFDGKETGYFILKDWDKKIGQQIVGAWYSMDGKKSYPVTLKVIGKGKN